MCIRDRDEALRKKLGVPDNYLKADGTVNLSAMKDWRSEKAYTWHHHQDMQTMQLVERPIHSPDVSPHTGGASYAKSVLAELEKRGEDVSNGLVPELIQRAKNLGIIPLDFPLG
jgi:hypothetical protein